MTQQSCWFPGCLGPPSQPVTQPHAGSIPGSAPVPIPITAGRRYGSDGDLASVLNMKTVGFTGKLRLQLKENVLSPSFCTCVMVTAPQGLVQRSLKRGGPRGSQDAFSGAYEQKLFPY